jgi:hypothetical protein
MEKVHSFAVFSGFAEAIQESTDPNMPIPALITVLRKVEDRDWQSRRMILSYAVLQWHSVKKELWGWQADLSQESGLKD